MESWFGLYYPHVHFRDSAWLKLAALYWDRLYRLHIPDYASSLPQILVDEVALAGAGFVLSVAPSDDAKERAGWQFIDACDELRLPAYREPIEVERDNYEDAVALWKVRPEFVELLLDMDLAVPSQHSPGWLTMLESLAHAYLLTLGAEVASEISAFPVADTAFDHSAVSVPARRLVAGLYDQPCILQRDEQEVLLVNLAVATVLPRDLATCPVETIIAIRERYAAERARFRKSVSDLMVEISGLEGVRDPAVLLNHIQAFYEVHIGPSLRDLERAMQGMRVDTVLGAMNVQTTAPVLLTSALATLAMHPSAPIATTIGLGGLSLGVWKSAREVRRQRNQALATMPAAYLYHINQQLSPSVLADQVRLASRRFAPPHQ